MRGYNYSPLAPSFPPWLPSHSFPPSFLPANYRCPCWFDDEEEREGEGGMAPEEDLGAMHK